MLNQWLLEKFYQENDGHLSRYPPPELGNSNGDVQRLFKSWALRRAKGHHGRISHTTSNAMMAHDLQALRF